MKKLKVLEWNINMRSKNYIEIPEWVLNEIVKKEPDVIVLVEYKNGSENVVKNNELLSNFLEKNIGEYLIEYYDPDENSGEDSKKDSEEEGSSNGILIALRKNRFRDVKVPIHQDTNKDTHPNWLAVQAVLTDTNEEIVIAGIRVRVDSRNEADSLKDRKGQIDNFLSELNEITPQKKQIVIGDFNYGPHKTEYKKDSELNWQDIIDMIRDKNYLQQQGEGQESSLGLTEFSPYSPIGTSFKNLKLDWLLIRGFQIKGYSDYNQLDWSFGINNKHPYTVGYNVPEGYFIRTDPGYPDHAIFTVELI